MQISDVIKFVVYLKLPTEKIYIILQNVPMIFPNNVHFCWNNKLISFAIGWKGNTVMISQCLDQIYEKLKRLD